MKVLILFLSTLTLLMTGFVNSSAQQAQNMFEETISAVVTVAVYENNELANEQLEFRGPDDESSVSAVAYKRALDLAGAQSSGSGFVISHNGKPYVVTNAHVIEMAADKPGSIAIFSIDRTKYEVNLIGGDSFYDIAVLEFVDEPKGELNTVKFRETKAALGEKVYAIGNPLGDYPYSISDGIISAKNRVRGGLTGKFGFLQTTATVIWGNSGGPLVDVNGDVIGINSQIAFTQSGSQNIWLSQINFALEGGLSQRLVENIIENDGRVERAYFGLEFSQDEEYNYQTGIVSAGPVILSGVVNDAPSKDEFNSLKGAELTQINETPIRSLEEALYELELVRPGQSITLHMNSNGSTVSKTARSVALETRQLESIAALFLQGMPGLEMTSASPQIGIQFNQKDNVQSYEEDSFQELENPETYLGQNYIVLAAGIKGRIVERMWRTKELYDLGGALKLSGLQGIVDLYVANSADPDEEIKVFRRSFSDDEDITTKRLWY